MNLPPPLPNLRLAQRPNVGTSGKTYQALVNCFAVSPPTTSFVHYDVIKPDEHLFRRRKTEIINKLQVEVDPARFNPLAVYDGKSNLFAFHDVLHGQVQKSFEVNMSRRNPPPGQNQTGLFKVTLTQVGRLTKEHLNAVLQGLGEGVPITTTSLQVLNVLVQQASKFSREFIAHTRNASYTDHRKEVFGGLEIWSGFFQSVRPTAGKLYINVDTATAVMYQAGYLPDIAVALCGGTNRRLLDDLHPGHPSWHKLCGALKGVKLDQENGSKIRVVMKVIAQAGNYSFELDDGQKITIEEYFRTMKNRPLRFPKWPGVQTKRGDIIPFELCEVRPGQFYRKKLSPDMMTRVLNFSKKKPEDRFNAIEHGVQRLGLTSSTYIAQSGMSINAKPMQVTGRVLDPPTLQYGSQAPLVPKFGSWNLVGMRLRDPQRIYSWAVVCFDTSVSQNHLQSFVTNLVNCMDGLGMAVADHTPPIRQEGPSRVREVLFGARMAAIKSQSNQARAALKPDALPTMILVVLQDNSADVKKQVKQWGDIEFGVPTQCVKGSKARNANDQYLKNLCLKINAKLGGVNVAPVGREVSWFEKNKAMVIGIDVTHPAPGAQRPSMAGLVASLDKNVSRYVATTSIQPPRVEIVEHLKDMLMTIIPMFNVYRRLTEKVESWPQHLIIFRDGVSEGELHQVVDKEFSEVKKAIDLGWAHEGMPAEKPKVTFIVVGKRHHIRFAPGVRGTGDKSGNCPAGFIVDDKIVSPGIFDFYLQSQGGLLGTSRPSHYIVVKDENNFTSDQLQAFCYTLCHTYARATRSVSIPAPVYYADIVCERADYHFNPSLNYADEGSSTETGEFDMKKWQDGYRGTHKNLARNMFFM